VGERKKEVEPQPEPPPSQPAAAFGDLTGKEAFFAAAAYEEALIDMTQDEVVAAKNVLVDDGVTAAAAGDIVGKQDTDGMAVDGKDLSENVEGAVLKDFLEAVSADDFVGDTEFDVEGELVHDAAAPPCEAAAAPPSGAAEVAGVRVAAFEAGALDFFEPVPGVPGDCARRTCRLNACKDDPIVFEKADGEANGMIDKLVEVVDEGHFDIEGLNVHAVGAVGLGMPVAEFSDFVKGVLGVEDVGMVDMSVERAISCGGVDKCCDAVGMFVVQEQQKANDAGNYDVAVAAFEAGALDFFEPVLGVPGDCAMRTCRLNACKDDPIVFEKADGEANGMIDKLVEVVDECHFDIEGLNVHAVGAVGLEMPVAEFSDVDVTAQGMPRRAPWADEAAGPDEQAESLAAQQDGIIDMLRTAVDDGGLGELNKDADIEEVYVILEKLRVSLHAMEPALFAERYRAYEHEQRERRRRQHLCGCEQPES
jgi:hypothetical protein